MGVELCGGYEQWAVAEQGTLNPPTDAASQKHRIPDGSGWNALQWLICSSLPAQPGSSQSTSHRSVTRLFWNIFSEGDSTPSLGSQFQGLVTAQESCSSLSSDGSYWASVPAHYLLSYCWAQWRKAWLRKKPEHLWLFCSDRRMCTASDCFSAHGLRSEKRWHKALSPQFVLNLLYYLSSHCKKIVVVLLICTLMAGICQIYSFHFICCLHLYKENKCLRMDNKPSSWNKCLVWEKVSYCRTTGFLRRHKNVASGEQHIK